MSKHLTLTAKGFTIVELMVTVAVLAIVTAVALPNFNEFITKTRVDNEVSELYRLLLTARNTAINSDQNVTICPLAANSTCNNDWHKELSVFTDLNSNGIYEPANNEELIKVKAAISSGDKLEYGQNSLVYMPTGRLSGSADAEPFKYCPGSGAEHARGIEVSASGRFYSTSDIDNDGKDETRAGVKIVCS